MPGMAKAGVPVSWLTFPIGTLKTLGALGLAAGLLFRPLGVSAAIGLVLGGSQARYQANSPIAYLPSLPFRHRLAVVVDAPANDPGSRSDILRVAHELAARGQFVSLQIARGVGHTWQEARLELPYSLVFASRHLSAGGSRRP